MADAVALTVCTSKEIPVLAAEHVEEEIRLARGAVQETAEQSAVPLVCASVLVARADRMIAVCNTQCVEEVRGVAADLVVPVVQTPFRDLHAAELRHQRNLWQVDHG